ncbi:acyl carrier protein [Hymenobacter coccineus]|uniref:Carrier domain-containing protein n=1 Tax=Hymenobacter coccineus TaxID=1908235 RepID=A0A1G1SU10_9BACT|nr:acyl carrier protein [Hymenobacter coccineus]OGX82118.1 hypothetical protein BEN49_02920 [Hymenobacter coccineus]
MTPSIQASVAFILRRHFLVRPRHFRPTQRLEQDYNLGPLDKLELANYLEQAFHFDFSDQEIAEFRTLGSVVASVKRHVHHLPTAAIPHFQPGYELAAA